jgi:hypothetical protein
MNLTINEDLMNEFIRCCIVFVFAVSAVLTVPVETRARDSIWETNAPLPAFAELEPGWNTMKPGGETTCAHGTDFEFYVRAGVIRKLMIYFYGGGACWDAKGCVEGSTIYNQYIRPDRHPDRLLGIFDLDHPENPFTGYTMIGIPVCTGDVHVGNRDVRYVLEDEDGVEREFVIRHRGQTNVRAVLDWIYSNFENPREIFVGGSSAGSLAVPLYANLIAQHYPDARVVGLGDDAGSYGREATKGGDVTVWGIPDVLRSHHGWEDIPGGLGVEDLFITASRNRPNLRLYQIDHAYDNTQYFYIERTGNPDPDVLSLLRYYRDAIRKEVPDFRSFTIGGFRHTTLQQEYFYRYHVDGERLRDWVAAIAQGDDINDVDCEDCSRSEFIYDEFDYAIVDGVIKLLSEPDKWNPEDAGGACPHDADRFSLRCAVSEVTRIVSGQSLSLHTAPWDIIYETAVHTGERSPRSIIVFNNDPDTTPDKVIALLKNVRDRIGSAMTGENSGYSGQ